MGGLATPAPRTALKRILDDEGRRQTWLAERIGVDPATLNRYVNGLHCPDDKKLLIADALSREVAEVFPPEVAA